MSTFTLPGDLDLAEYETPFDTPDQLAEFILDADNDSEGYTVLRAFIFDFTYSVPPVFTDWQAILTVLIQYRELPHGSLAVHGLYVSFRATARRLKGWR